MAQEFHDVSTNRGGVEIPVLWGTDAVHGHSNVIGATIFPHNIGLGATQNTELLELVGAAVAEEVLARAILDICSYGYCSTRLSLGSNL